MCFQLFTTQSFVKPDKSDALVKEHFQQVLLSSMGNVSYRETARVSDCSAMAVVDQKIPIFLVENIEL
jgi:hypothetical protein